MARVYISIGSNVDARRHIRSCLQALVERFGPLEVSTIYRSRAVGFDGDDFLNLVVGCDTPLDPRMIAIQLRDIETAHGRRRDGPRFSARPLDLDLLLYDDQDLTATGLDVPREEITRYAFVLQPLAELAGDCRHPQLGLTFAELWARFPKDGEPLTPVAWESPPAGE